MTNQAPTSIDQDPTLFDHAPADAARALRPIDSSTAGSKVLVTTPNEGSVDSRNPQPACCLAAEVEHDSNIDSDFAELASRIPGFGGLYMNSAGLMTVNLVDTTRLEAYRPALAAFLAAHGTDLAAAKEMRARYAPHDYRELVASFTALNSSLNLSGITQRDIDEARNQVVIGVIDPTTAERVVRGARALNLADDLIAVEVIPPTVISGTLQQSYRPVVGGLQVGTSRFFCSLGWNVRPFRFSTFSIDSNQTYFVTNSHCTGANSEFGVTTGTVFGQPDINSPIGLEVYDPPLFTNQTKSECPAGRRCRRSDAALERYNSGVSRSFGRIAKVSSGLTISGTLDIIETDATVLQGQTVYKVGRTTGYTSGPNTGSCVTVSQYENVNGVAQDTGRDLICQNQADYPSGPGDSGSPVFTFGYQSTTRITIQGLHWGTSYSQYNNPGSELRATFSRSHDIRGELAPYFGSASVSLYGSNSDN